MKLITVLFLSLISSIFTAQDTIKYNGIIAGKILYESIELYPDSTFKWTSEYDLSFSSYGKYQIDNNQLRLDYYIDLDKPTTMSLSDSIAIVKIPTKSEVFLLSNGKMYRTDDRGNKKSRIKDQSLKSSWSGLFGHQYVLIKEG